ncbi:helix-hairpin-helix domain-containing protein [Desulfococcaceae bacterium HSG7]|nr:helix-hairpin-helix domain-containing protein [Desulfococcaceae bacterium HSG7]
MIENANNWESFVDTTDEAHDDFQDDEETFGGRSDVKSEANNDETTRPGYETLIVLPNVSRDLADALYEEGFCSAEELSLAIAEDLTAIKGLSEEDAYQLIENADNWESFLDTTDGTDDDFQDDEETFGRSDVKSETSNDETMRPGYETLIVLPNVSRDLADALYEEGFCSAEELSLAIAEDLTAIKGLSEEDAYQLIENADNWESFLDQTDETDTDIVDDEDAPDHKSDVSIVSDSLNEHETGDPDELPEIAESDDHDDQKPADMVMPEKDSEIDSHEQESDNMSGTKEPDVQEKADLENEQPLPVETEDISNFNDSEV